MLLDVDAVAYAGGHGHPTFTDIVVVVIDHNVETEWLGEEVVGDAQGIGWNSDKITHHIVSRGNDAACRRRREWRPSCG